MTPHLIPADLLFKLACLIVGAGLSATIWVLYWLSKEFTR